MKMTPELKKSLDYYLGLALPAGSLGLSLMAIAIADSYHAPERYTMLLYFLWICFTVPFLIWVHVKLKSKK